MQSSASAILVRGFTRNRRRLASAAHTPRLLTILADDPQRRKCTNDSLSSSLRPNESRTNKQTSTLFSTAAARDFDEHDEMYIPKDGAYIDGGHESRPRLHALRERLRSEGIHRISPRRKLAPHQSQILQQSVPPSHAVTENSIEQSHDHLIDNILTDTHGRHHNYLRISLSERCNLRCQYCMPPEGIQLSPSSNLLTDQEITRLVDVFVKNGVDKVRLTGGEPLLRPNLASLIRQISSSLRTADRNLSGSGLVGITTNGISLSRQIDALVDAGLTGVNISLDTLRSDRFLEITRRNGLEKVMRAIHDTIRAFREKYGDVRLGPNGTGGSRVKINCVVMKDFNDDELVDFVDLVNNTFCGDVDMRFIEWMPFNDNGWNMTKFLSYEDMMDNIDSKAPLERIEDGPNDTTKWWTVQNQASVRKSRIGFITSMSEHFCSSCNRLRITADGKIKVCLFGSNEKEVSLRDIMRNRSSNNSRSDEEELSEVIYAAVQRKSFALGGHGNAEAIAKAADNRPMTTIGG